MKCGCSFVALSLLLFAGGCSNSDDLYPLKLGETWTYTVKNSFSTRVQQVTVKRRLPVAFTTGYELEGPMGLSRLAWSGGVLYAEMLPNTRFYKPLPILIGKDAKASMSWSGNVESSGSVQKADVRLVQEPYVYDEGVKKLDTVHVTLSVDMGKKDIELETWYAKGKGPVKQEQRTNGKLDVSVEWQGGP